MKVIYTKNFPPGEFHGINLFGVLFAKRRFGKMLDVELNHELIHTKQQIEMLFLFFYLWYGVEFLVRMFQYRFDRSRAYYNISFEREAYANMKNPEYKYHRKRFSWTKYLKIKGKNKKNHS
ncbi:MAG: hypothetical protein KBT33_09630 [Prevotellaceae bacterium]|nr:hypothetical protein [Candidatus Minthosoma equi]